MAKRAVPVMRMVLVKMLRRMFNRLLAIALVAFILEMMRRVRLVLSVVRTLEAIVRRRESEGRTQPLQED